MNKQLSYTTKIKFYLITVLDWGAGIMLCFPSLPFLQNFQTSKRKKIRHLGYKLYCVYFIHEYYIHYLTFSFFYTAYKYPLALPCTYSSFESITFSKWNNKGKTCFLNTKINIVNFSDHNFLWYM